MRTKLCCLALVCLLASPARAQVIEEETGPIKYMGLRAAGLATLGGVYTINIAVAVISAIASPRGSAVTPLLIPIAGPWVALGHPSNQLPAGITLLVFDGLSQLASTTMVVMAIVLHQLELPQTAWRVSPGPGGITFSAQFP